MKFLSIFLSVLLTPQVAILPLQAEMTVPVPGGTTPSVQAGSLQIRLADAGKAVVEANTSVKGYAILVTDSGGLPVSEAAVSIRLPEDAATGFFADGEHSAVSYTNAAGVATFAQVNWGPAVGIVSIRVTAVKGELHAGAIIEQTIVAKAVATGKAVARETKMTPLPSGPSAAATPAAGAGPQPGTPASVASFHSGAASGPKPAATTTTGASAEPAVSIVNTGGNKGSHSNKKWVVLGALAAAAGIGAALALSGKGAASVAAPSSPALSIGTPTISVGH
jgi:hypothetical protein